MKNPKRYLLLFPYLGILLTCFFSLSANADERARKGKCYITGGFGENKQETIKLAQRLNLGYQFYELFERKDKKIYITVGKVDKQLFEKLKLENKIPEGYYCSQGKGFQKRYNFTSDYRIFPGDKRFIDSEADFNKIFNIKAINNQSISLTTNQPNNTVKTQNSVILKSSTNPKPVPAVPIQAKQKFAVKTTVNPQLQTTNAAQLDLENFKLLHPAWYTDPTNFIENQFSTSSCAVIKNGDFNAAKSIAFNNARKDINTFLGNDDAVNASNQKNYLSSLQAGVYLSRSEQVYINNLPFYCTLASISYSNVKKIQESQLSISRSVANIKSDLTNMIDQKVTLAARGVLFGSKDFRDIYRNFNSYIDYGEYELAHQMFESFIALNTEVFDAHKTFIYKMQNYKSNKEIQEIYRNLYEAYPLNQSIRLAYSSTLNKIEYILTLRNMVLENSTFAPAYYEFLIESDLMQELTFVPSIILAKKIATEKNIQVGEFNLTKYYPFSTDDIRKRFSWLPNTSSVYAQMMPPQNQPFISAASPLQEGIVNLSLSEQINFFAYKIQYSLDGAPYVEMKRQLGKYGMWTASIEVYEKQNEKYSKILAHPDLIDKSQDRRSSFNSSIYSFNQEIEALDSRIKKYQNNLMQNKDYQDAKKNNNRAVLHGYNFELEGLKRQLNSAIENKKRAIDSKRQQLTQSINTNLKMMNGYIEAYEKQKHSYACKDIINLVTLEKECVSNMAGMPIKMMADKEVHSISFRITDILNEISFREGEFKLLY
jgi:hypothetical protein